MYRIPPETMLRRVSYHGRLPFAAPLACDVADAAGVLHRAEYVPDSMLEYGHARYTIDDQTYVLQRNGELVAVAEQERRAA